MTVNNSNQTYKLLAEALKTRISELKVIAMKDLSDAVPHFNFRTFARVFTYHVLNMFILGPLAALVVIPFSGL